MEDKKLLVEMFGMMKEMQTEISMVREDIKSLDIKIENGFNTMANIIRDEVPETPEKKVS